MNLEINQWKEFKLYAIFTIHNGKGITKEEIEENEGDFTVVQSGEENNGVLGKISREYCEMMDYTFCDEPCLTVARSGSAGYVSFQINGCVVGDSAKILLLDKSIASVELYVFLQTLLTANRFKYAYGRKVTESKYMNDVVKLPIQCDSNGTPLIDKTKKYSDEGYIPDWEWMKTYIKSLNYKPLTTKNKSDSVPNLNIEGWKEFRVGDFFDIHPTKFIEGVSAGDCVGFGVPLVVNSAENNGVAGFCDLEPTEKGGIITFSDTTEGNTFFYQDTPFIGFAHVQGMYPKTRVWSKYELLFFSTMLMFDSRGKYSYGRKMRRDTISEILIKLPVDATGEPDWSFMEKYMKSLPYGDRL